MTLKNVLIAFVLTLSSGAAVAQDLNIMGCSGFHTRILKRSLLSVKKK